MPESPPDPKAFLDSLLDAARRAARKEVATLAPQLPDPEAFVKKLLDAARQVAQKETAGLRAEVAALRQRVDELETMALERMEERER